MYRFFSININELACNENGNEMEYEQCNISNKKQKLLKAGNLWKLS